jgi:TPR repeat protein
MGHAMGYSNIGNMFQNSKLILADYEKAVEYYTKAINLGFDGARSYKKNA